MLLYRTPPHRPRFLLVKSLGLSTPNKTRHSRHFASNQLILLAKVMSGFSKTPDNHPTFLVQNPTFDCY